jgi:hypothetical protein
LDPQSFGRDYAAKVFIQDLLDLRHDLAIYNRLSERPSIQLISFQSGVSMRTRQSNHKVEMGLKHIQVFNPTYSIPKLSQAACNVGEIHIPLP